MAKRKSSRDAIRNSLLSRHDAIEKALTPMQIELTSLKRQIAEHDEVDKSLAESAAHAANAAEMAGEQ